MKEQAYSEAQGKPAFEQLEHRLLLSSGLVWPVPEYDPVEHVQATGVDIQANAWSVSCLADWNNDGLVDLLVGEKTNDVGKVRVYLNEGSAAQPLFGNFSYVQSGEADLTVPA